MKRFLCIVLLLMLVLSSVPAYAAHTAVQDGMSVTLITDKDVYAAGEPVEAVLRVQNLHDADIRNVRTEIKAPHNVRLMGGGKARLPHLKAHETHEHTDVLHNGSTPDLPHTGDSAHIGLWLALLTLSFAGCVCLVAIRRPKAGSRWLSLLLCVVLVGSSLPAHVHAETQDKTITVSKQVTVDGQPTDITGTVTYSADVAVLTVANYMINEMAEDIKVHVGDTLALSGIITAPSDALLSGVQVLIYEENEEEPYTVGEEYFSFAPAAMQYDLALVPQMIVGEPFGESEFALMEGGRYVVMLRAADSKGSAFADSDAEAEGLQGPQLSLRVLADPANCDHSSKEYTYERDYATASRVTYTGSDTSHLVEPAYKRYCADCGTFLMNIWGEGEEAWHTMKDGMCTECGYTVEAVTYADAHTVCNHEGATSRLLTTYVFHSDSEFHTRQELYSTTCSECELGTNNILTLETQEAHTFGADGICTICNYVQSTSCTHDWLQTTIITNSHKMYKYDENHNEIESTEHSVTVIKQIVCVLCKAIVDHEQTSYLEEHSYDSNGMCESCGYSPEITCPHDSTYADGASVAGYEQIEGSVSKHYVIKTRTEQRCLNCGITLPANDYSKVAEFHVFEDGVCACGAIEQPCEHPSTTATVNPAGISGYTNVTETQHNVIKSYVDLCDECGQPVGKAYYLSNTEVHTFVNGTCACGATKAPEAKTPTLTAIHQGNGEYLFHLTTDNASSATLYFEQDGAVVHSINMTSAGSGTFTTNYTFNAVGTKNVYAITDDGATSNIVTLEITEDMLQSAAPTLSTPVLHQTSYSVKTNQYITVSCDVVENAQSYHVSIYNKESNEYIAGYGTGGSPSFSLHFTEAGEYRIEVYAANGDTESEHATATVSVTHEEITETDTIRLSASKTKAALGELVDFTVFSDTDEIVLAYFYTDFESNSKVHKAGELFYRDYNSAYNAGHAFIIPVTVTFYVLSSDGRKSNTVTVTWGDESEVITPTLTATHHGNGKYTFTLTTDDVAGSGGPFAGLFIRLENGLDVGSTGMPSVGNGVFEVEWTFEYAATRKVYATYNGTTSNTITLEITEDMLQPSTPTLATPVLHQTSYSVKTNQTLTLSWDAVENAEYYYIFIYEQSSGDLEKGIRLHSFDKSYSFLFEEAGDYRIEVYAESGDIQSERATATVSVSFDEIIETDKIQLSASKTRAAVNETVDFTIISDTDDIMLVSVDTDSHVQTTHQIGYWNSAYRTGIAFGQPGTADFYVLSSDGRKSNTVTVTWGDESEVITPTLTATHQGNGEYLFSLTTDNASSATLYFEQDGAVVHSINMTSAGGGTFTTNYTFNSVGTKNVYAITDDDVTSNILTLDITEDMLNPTLDAPTITTSDHSAVAGEPDVINWTAVDGAEGYTIAVYKNKQTVTSDCTISYNGCSASIIFPSEGVYVVQAAAKKDGYNAAWSNGVNVTVTEAEPEEEVELSVSDDEVEIGDTLVITATTNADSVTLVMTAEDGSASTVAMTQSAAGTFVHRLSASSAQSLTLHAVTPNGTESNKVTVTIYCPHTSSTDTYNPNIQPVYSNITETHHDVSSGYTPLCDECGEPTGANGYFDAVTQEHTFEDGVCVCGASENPAEDKLAAPVPAQASMTAIRGEQVTIRWNASAGAERYGVWFYDTNPATYVDAGTNLYVTHTFEHNSPQGAPFSVQVYALAGTGADQQQSEPGVISVTVECGEHDYSDALVYTNTLFKPVDDEYHLAYADVYSVTCTECGATNPAYTIERDPEDYEQDKHAYDAKGMCQSDGCGHECLDYAVPVIAKVELTPTSGQAGDRFTLTVTTNEATEKLSAINNSNTPLKDGAFKHTDTKNGKKVWKATYTAEEAHANRYWTVTPYNGVGVAGGEMKSNEVAINSVVTDYVIYYRWDSGADQVLNGSVINGTKGEVAYLTLWAKRFENGQAVEWIQPSKDNGYQFKVSAGYPANTDSVLVFETGSQAKINGLGLVNINLVDSNGNILTSFSVQILDNTVLSMQYSVSALYSSDKGDAVQFNTSSGQTIVTSANPLNVWLSVEDSDGNRQDVSYSKSSVSDIGDLYWVTSDPNITFSNEGGMAYIGNFMVSKNYVRLHGFNDAKYSLTLMSYQGILRKDTELLTITLDVDRKNAYLERYKLISKDILVNDEYTQNNGIDGYAYDEKGKIKLRFTAFDNLSQQELAIGDINGAMQSHRDFELIYKGSTYSTDSLTLTTGKHTIELRHCSSGVVVDTLIVEILNSPPMLSGLDFGTVYTEEDVDEMIGLIDRTIALSDGVLQRYGTIDGNIFVRGASGVIVCLRSAIDNGPSGISDGVYDLLYEGEIVDTDNFFTEYLGAHNQDREVIENLLIQELITTELEAQILAQGYYEALSSIAEVDDVVLSDLLEEASSLIGNSEKVNKQELIKDLTKITSKKDLEAFLIASGYGEDTQLYKDVVSLKNPATFPEALERRYAKKPKKYEDLKKKWDAANEWKDVLEKGGMWLDLFGAVSDGLTGYSSIQAETERMTNIASHQLVKQKLLVLRSSTNDSSLQNAIDDMIHTLSYIVEQQNKDIAKLNFETGGTITVSILTQLSKYEKLITSQIAKNAIQSITSSSAYKLAKKALTSKIATAGANILLVWDGATLISNTFLVDGQTTSRLYSAVEVEVDLLKEKRQQLLDYDGSSSAELQNFMYTTRMLINSTVEHNITYYNLVRDVYTNDDWLRQAPQFYGELFYPGLIEDTLKNCQKNLNEGNSIKEDLLALSN